VSVIQPSVPSATKEILDTVLVQAPDCTGSCADRIWFLHNAPTAGNTTQRADMPMDLNAPVSTTLFNYDTNRDSSPGRQLSKGGHATETDLSKMVNWRTVAAANTSFNGDVVIRFYAAIKDLKPDKRGDLIAYVRSQDASGVWGLRGTSATFSLNPWGPDYKEAVLRVPVNFTINAGQRIEVKIVSGNNSGDDLWVAYDTISHPAKATFPAVAP
jgi:hypothetical protein